MKPITPEDIITNARYFNQTIVIALVSAFVLGLCLGLCPYFWLK